METKKEVINPYPMAWGATLFISSFNSLNDLVDYLEISGGLATVKIFHPCGGMAKVGVLVDRWIVK